MKNTLFIEENAAEKLLKAQASMSPEMLDKMTSFNAENENYECNSDNVFSTSGEKAIISINGVLSKKPDFFALFFGMSNTVYSDIISAINKAEASPSVKEIELHIDSPGGQADGLFEAMDAIYTCSKKTIALVSGTAASAAYGLASQANEIHALSRVAIFGSVGVVVDKRKRPDYLVSVTSRKSPKKNPDVRTETGVELVKDELDQYYEEFSETIARGRGTTTEKVESDFGKGGLFIASLAKQNGMIDIVHDNKILSKQDKSLKADSSINPKKVISMDKETLKRDHSSLYASILEEGRKEGREQETKNVSLHYRAGKKFNCSDVAFENASKGILCDSNTFLEYQLEASSSDFVAKSGEGSDNIDPGKPEETKAGTENKDTELDKNINDIAASL